MISHIISGHQTGVDLGAIDAAISLGIQTGGYVPKGRIFEDGTIPAWYATCRETPSTGYVERTRLNVQTADTTVCFYRKDIGRGTGLTIREAERQGKTYLVFDLEIEQVDGYAMMIAEMADSLSGVVNFAGSRESSSPDIQATTYRIVREVIRQQRELATSPI